MKTVEFECVCPVCRERLTHATALDGPASETGNIPIVGDVTVCAMCTSLLEFDEQLKPFVTDIDTLEPELQPLIRAAMAFIKSSYGRRLLH